MVTRALFLQANLLGALREGDYSIRGAGAKPGSAVDLVMQEINALGDTLQRQRTEAVESTTLLQSVMGAIDVAVFAFDMDEHLVLVNPAAERLLGQPAASLLGRSAQRAAPGRLPRPATRRGCIDRPFGPESGRLELRRSTFRRDGKPHQLLVFADLSRALREEEQQAWQRIVRVLSHEINNSLTPIKSIAHSIKRMLSRVPDLPRAGEIQDGLNLIETRSGVARAGSCAPTRSSRGCRSRSMRHGPDRAARPPASPSSRTGCRSRSRRRSDVEINADPDQLEQLLINIVRNAVDATLETERPRVDRLGSRSTAALQVTVEDEGPGPAGHVQPVRAVLHDQADRIRHRPGAEPADRGGPRRHADAREPQPAPGDAGRRYASRCAS